MFLFFMFACQEQESSELSDLQSQLISQAAMITQLQEKQAKLQETQEQLLDRIEYLEENLNETLSSRISNLEFDVSDNRSDIQSLQEDLNTQDARIGDMETDIFALQSTAIIAADLTPYATQTWTLSQGFATQTWIQTQNYGLASDIVANTQLISSNTNALTTVANTANTNNIRLNVIENDYATSTDFIGYATENWVSNRNYALNVDLQMLITEKADLDQLIHSHTISLTDIDTRVSNIEADYISSSTVSGLATQAWVAQNYALQSVISAMETQQDQNMIDILALQASVSTISSDYLTSDNLIGLATEDWVSSNAALGSIVTDLTDYVTVDTNTNSVIFSGANVYFQSGSGTTNDGTSQGSPIRGLGNVIIGYNETDGSQIRTGSHNLVIGDLHSYEGFGGFVAGKQNHLQGEYSSILSGKRNTVTGNYSSICGGFENISSGNHAAVLGGYQNEASNSFATVSGGGNNLASGFKTSVSGGTDNVAFGNASAILGGDGNETTGLNTTISGGVYGETIENYSNIAGGYANTTMAMYSSILGGAENTASGQSSSILGGYLNETFGLRSSIAAGHSNTVNSAHSSICGGYLNTVDGAVGTISGGAENYALGEYSSINGGYNNETIGNYSTVLGGNANSLSGLYSTSP